MKITAVASSLLLLAPPALLVSGQYTGGEFYGIQACCDSGCDEACDWTEENPQVIVTSNCVREPGDNTPCPIRRGFGRHLQVDQLRGDDLINANCCIGNGGSGGDPHIMTWNGGYFDYHGQCDLVLVDAPDFAQGLGLTVQIRTRLRRDYSFIETAAIKIGKEDILEVSAFGEHVLNGVESANLEGQFLAAFPIEYQMVNKKRHRVTIDLGDNQKVVFNTMKDWVSVSFENATAKDFKTAKGLMGHFFTGTRMARDGFTEITQDDNAYGQEWQVTPQEAGLFLNQDREPQAPQQQCILPIAAESTRRRLGEASVTEEAANVACQHFQQESVREMCVYDVLASDDLEMALAGAF